MLFIAFFVLGVLQLGGADTDEEVRQVFDDADHELTLLETGFKKPLSALTLGDKGAVISNLKTHSCEGEA